MNLPSLLFRYGTNKKVTRSGRTGRPRSLILLMSRETAYSRSLRPINIFAPRAHSQYANRKPCVVSGIIYDRTSQITSAGSDLRPKSFSRKTLEQAVPNPSIPGSA
jgi:hypothetical protein